MTPYTGGNFGDWAIQEATIANIRERHPDACMRLVTMRPAMTTELHGLPSIPIGRAHPWPTDRASPCRAEAVVHDHRSTPAQQSALGGLKAAVKSTRLLYAVLKPVSDTYNELRHLGRVYRFLRGVDILIVSGGGQLDELWGGPWAHPYALFKWGLLANLAGSRFLVLSVGACELESKASRFFIRHALRLASYRSYRDRTSKELLRDMAFTRTDKVYPDLAFSYSHDALGKESATKRSCRVVGVSPIAYLAPGWPQENAAVFQRYFQTLVAFVQILIERGHSVVLFTSTDGPDQTVVSDMVDALTQEGELDLSGRLRHSRTDTLPQLLEQLGEVDCVVASRLHGILLSHRFNLPVLAISYDRKVDTYMGDLGMSEYRVDIHNFTTDSLHEVFEELTKDSESIRSKLVEVNRRYARELEEQYDAVLGP